MLSSIFEGVHAMTESIAQVSILVLGLVAIFLVLKKNKWGSVCGLLSQPFWFVTAYQHEQLGIFALNIGYFFVWSYGVWQGFVEARKILAKKKSVLSNRNIDLDDLSKSLKDAKPFSLTLTGEFEASDVAELLFALGGFYESVGGQELRFYFDRVRILVKPHDHPEW